MFGWGGMLIATRMLQGKGEISLRFSGEEKKKIRELSLIFLADKNNEWVSNYSY